MGDEYDIVQLTTADFEESIDFLNLVFGAYRPHDFVNMLPAVYRPEAAWMQTQYGIRQNGRIRALVGIIPRTLQVGAVTLRGAGIGGVATHPNFRQSGMMRQLMVNGIQVMLEQGCQFSWLAGERPRYLRFGYEVCGSLFAFGVSQKNLRTAAPAASAGILFLPAQPEERAHLAAAVRLHDRQLIHCVRDPADFLLYGRSWHRRPHVALDAQGNFLGWLTASPTGDYVGELLAIDEEAAFAILCAWVLQRNSGDSVTLDLPPLPSGLARTLYRCADGAATVRASGNWQIFDWPAVIGALLQLKLQTSGPLLSGKVTVEIEEYGRICLEVDGTSARCEKTRRTADVTGSAAAIMRLLCGPLPPSAVMLLPSAAMPLAAWCPLPLYLPRQDTV